MISGTERRDAIALPSYRNPVYAGSFPDPFVLKFRGEYWAYATGRWSDGRIFGILHSTDLIHWEEVGGALAPLPTHVPDYWAPEVFYRDGAFYLYYAAGTEAEDMAIRVAVSERPEGPFVDTGRRLTSEPFAIDAHVFQDNDGALYLFYATDFLDHHHIGTGTVVDRLLDPLTPEGKPVPVARARYDWQVYDPNRAEKGGVRWHTVEGPFVLKRRGRYYEMFSGGNWQNTTYGVSYATSDRIVRPDEWDQAVDGAKVLPILRSIPGEVLGPGHNSVVRGPDNRQLFCVYHEWVNGERVMALDRLEFIGSRLAVFGPSTSPRIAPLPPALNGFAEGQLGTVFRPEGGNWVLRDGAVRQTEATGAALHFDLPHPVGLLEISVAGGAGSVAGLALYGDNVALFQCSIEGRVLHVTGADLMENRIPLEADFVPDAYHLLRVDLDGRSVHVALDGISRFNSRLRGRVQGGALLASGHACFAGFQLTDGWEQLFEEALPPELLGWMLRNVSGEVRDGALRLATVGATPGWAERAYALDAFEAVLNVQMLQAETDGWYGFAPVGPEGPVVRVLRQDGGWMVRAYPGHVSYPLPAGFDPALPQQFRWYRVGDVVELHWEGIRLGVVRTPPGPAPIALAVHAATVICDMVRVTALPPSFLPSAAQSS